MEGIAGTSILSSRWQRDIVDNDRPDGVREVLRSTNEVQPRDLQA